MQRPAENDESLDPRQFFERELDPDRKEDENDTNLSQVVDEIGIRHQSQRAGTDENAGDQKSGNRYKSNTITEISNQNAYHEQGDDLTQ